MLELLRCGHCGDLCGGGQERTGGRGVEAARQEGRVDRGQRRRDRVAWLTVTSCFYKISAPTWGGHCGVWQGVCGGRGGRGDLLQQGGDRLEVGVGRVGWEGET